MAAAPASAQPLMKNKPESTLPPVAYVGWVHLTNCIYAEFTVEKIKSTGEAL